MSVQAPSKAALWHGGYHSRLAGRRLQDQSPSACVGFFHVFWFPAWLYFCCTFHWYIDNTNEFPVYTPDINKWLSE